MPTCPYCKHHWEVKGRSKEQNNSYWGLLVTPFCEWLNNNGHEGHTVEDVHDMFKSEFLSKIEYIKDRNGNAKEVRSFRSTTSLTTKDFEEYCSKIRIWASQLGCYLSEPNEVPYESN